MVPGISCDPNSQLDSRVLSTTHFLFFRLNLKTFFKVIAVLLLAIWLPATQHCDLEAADVSFLGSGEHHTTSCQEVCKDDACHAIEGVSFGKTATELRALPPPESFASCLLSLLVAPVLVEREPVCFIGDSPEIQALHRTWQFVRRTALPARAPNCVA